MISNKKILKELKEKYSNMTEQELVDRKSELLADLKVIYKGEIDKAISKGLKILGYAYSWYFLSDILPELGYDYSVIDDVVYICLDKSISKEDFTYLVEKFRFNRSRYLALESLSTLALTGCVVISLLAVIFGCLSLAAIPSVLLCVASALLSIISMFYQKSAKGIGTFYLK